MEMWLVRLVGDVLNISLLHFVVLCLAVYRVTRFFISDHLFSPLRDKFWGKFPPESTKLGYLLTCPWCLGFWLSLIFFTCYTIIPLPTLYACYVLALSAVVGLLTALEDRM